MLNDPVGILMAMAKGSVGNMNSRGDTGQPCQESRCGIISQDLNG